MKVKLTIERFWLEPGNFELWCDILARIPLQTEARNIKDIARLYLGKDVEGADRKLDRSKELYGLMGCKYIKSSGDLEIKGVNFLADKDGFLCLTPEAMELVDAYRRGHGWEKILARQLLSFSPRTRVIMHLLLHGGTLQSRGYPLGELDQWQIMFDGELLTPFDSNPERNDMNRLLCDFKTQALGPMWNQVLAGRGLVLDADWQFAGSLGLEPTMHNIAAFMSCPMQLFDYLDWLVEKPDGSRVLELEKVAVDIDISRLFNVNHNNNESELQWLKNEIERCADYRGLFPVEKILEKLMARYYPYWHKGLPRFVDYYITSGLKDGLFVVADHDSGQPRHGRGYLGKREYQLIKLDFSQ